MARIKVDLPDRFSFSTELPLYKIHINMGAHLDNALLLSLVSEARGRYYRDLGYEEQNVEGLGTVVTDAVAQYLSEAHYGDVMVVHMTFCDANKYGGDLAWQMLDRDSGREVARGKTGFVFLTPDTRKVSPAPARFLDRALGREATGRGLAAAH